MKTGIKPYISLTYNFALSLISGKKFEQTQIKK